MRILHTADWHLGKKLDFYNRIDEQKEVLEEICSIAEQHQVDMVIVAGDLFDNANPANDAIELLYKTLKKLARNGKVPIIAIAGNHDSPSKINVADVLARESGIIFIGYPTDVVPLFSLDEGFSVSKTDIGFIEIKLPNQTFPVRVLHTAYANEMRLKECFSENKQASLQQSLTEKWTALSDKFLDDKGVNILTTHLFIAKTGEKLPDEPDGERPLNIGTADVVYSDSIPKSIQYAALGHLHRYQDVGKNQPAIYSSSPLAYSFSEAGQQKYVIILDIEPNKINKIDKIPLQTGKTLKRVSFGDVNSAIMWLSEHRDCLVELTIEIDEYIKADERKLIYQTHDGIIHLIPKIKNGQFETSTLSKNLDLAKDIDELFVDYFKFKNNGLAPNEEIMDLFHEILNQQQS